MKIILLTRGMVALVDDEDYERFGHLNWCAQSTGSGNFYAARRVNKKISLLHREIMGAGPKELVDHINGDKLDCRRQNLRLATPSQNCWNQRKGPRRMSSEFKGVCRVSPRVNRIRPWLAYIGSANGKTKRKYLGFYGTELEAAAAYNTAAILLFGAYAGLNPV